MERLTKTEINKLRDLARSQSFTYRGFAQRSENAKRREQHLAKAEYYKALEEKLHRMAQEMEG